MERVNIYENRTNVNKGVGGGWANIHFDAYFDPILDEPQTWKPSRGVVCYVQSERINLSFSLIAQTDIQVLQEKL